MTIDPRSSLDLLNRLVDASKNAVLVIDSERTICFANAAAVQHFESKPNPLLGSLIDGLIADQCREECLRDLAAAQNGVELKTLKWDMNRSDRATIPTEVQISSLDLDRQKHLALTIDDITERQYIESELTNSLIQVESLYRANQALLVSRSPEELLTSFRNAVVHDECSTLLYFIETDEDDLPLIAELAASVNAFGEGEYPVESRHQVRDIFAAEQLHQRYDKPLHVQSVLEGSDQLAPAHLGHLEEMGVRAATLIPLVVGVRWVGIVQMTWREPRELTDQERQFLDLIGPQIAPVVDNFRLLRQTRKAEQRFRSLIENASDIITVITPNGKIRYTSPATLNILGHDPDELTGSNIFQYIHPDDVRTVTEIFVEAFKKPATPADVEFRFRHSAGNWRFLSARGSITRNYHGDLELVINSRDVTIEKLAEESLRASEERNRTLIELLPDYLFYLSEDGRYVDVKLPENSAIGAEELLGKSIYDVIEREAADLTIHFVGEALRTGDLQTFEYQLQEPNGIREYEARMVVSGVDQVLAIVRDITERKQMVRDLRDSEARSRAIVNAIPDILFRLNSDGVFIDFIAERQSESSYLPPAQFLGKTLAEVMPEPVADAGIKALRAALKSQEIQLFEYELPDPQNGALRYFESRTSPIGLREAIVFIRDVTERKQAEERIRTQNEMLIRTNRELAIARHKAEESARLKSEFLATMSHELRTPLNAIIGYSEIQLAGMAGALTSEQQDYHKRILVNAENLLALINDVLDLAKIEAGRMDLAKREFALSDILEVVSFQMRGLADEKGLEFHTSLANDLPRILVGDPERIKQIAVNLVSNAIKFTESGFVSIKLVRQDESFWSLIVSDSGIGIPTHAVDYIFDEFRQVDGSTSRRYGGTGLGLAIVRNLVKMMGGNVAVQSEEGKGTSFTVTLPIQTVQTELWN